MGTIACCTTTKVSRSPCLSELSSLPALSLILPRASFLLFRNLYFTPRPKLRMASPLQVSASSTVGASQEGLEDSSPGLVGENDLLIVGPGVLGRMVAEQWRKEHPGCQIFGQTMTTDHHDELIKLGIDPSLRVTRATQQFPYVIFCAPPSRTVDYPGDVRLAASNWNGKGSFLFTSSSAPYDCYDNGSCDEDSPVVPIGRSPRTDVLLKAESVALEIGGCVLRLSALYISLPCANH